MHDLMPTQLLSNKAVHVCPRMPSFITCSCPFFLPTGPSLVQKADGTQLMSNNTQFYFPSIVQCMAQAAFLLHWWSCAVKVGLFTSSRALYNAFHCTVYVLHRHSWPNFTKLLWDTDFVFFPCYRKCSAEWLMSSWTAYARLGLQGPWVCSGSLDREKSHLWRL